MEHSFYLAKTKNVCSVLGQPEAVLINCQVQQVVNESYATEFIPFMLFQRGRIKKTYKATGEPK